MTEYSEKKNFFSVDFNYLLRAMSFCCRSIEHTKKHCITQKKLIQTLFRKIKFEFFHHKFNYLQALRTAFIDPFPLV